MITPNWGWMLAGLALMSAGCVVDTGSGEAPEEQVAQASDELVGGWAIPYTSNTPFATHLCVLTDLHGHFDAPTDFVQLTQSGDHWLLRKSASITSAKAYCFPRNLFKSNNADTVISPEVTATATAGETAQALALGGYAFTFLSGQKGVQGIKSWSNIVQSTSLTNSSLVQMVVNGSAYGRSFQVGTGAAHLARFVRADGTQGDVSTVPPFELPAQSGPLRVELAPTAKAVCTFTKLRSLRGEASLSIAPELVNGVEKWVLRTATVVTAPSQVRCFARDQTL